jgi:sugar phosphate isomerase/epimerase
MIITGSIAFLDDPLEQALARIKACGFDGVEIWQPHLVKCRTPALLSWFGRHARAIGLPVLGLNVIGFDWFQPFGTDAELATTLRQLKASADDAEALGVPYLMIWEGVRPARAGRNVLEQHCLPRLLDVLGEVLPYAEKKGLHLLSEPHPFTVGIDDWFAIELYDRLAAPNFGYIYDCCHYGVGRPTDYVPAIANLGHRIHHIHFADSDMKTSEFHFPPGEGALELDAIVNAFAAIGYHGTISLDLYGWPLPEQGAAIGVPYLRSVIERLGVDR